MRLFFLIISLFIVSNTYAKNPTESDIKAWLNQDKIAVENIQMVYLLGNERAYLADVTFDANDSVIKNALALARPELDEAEFISPFPPDYIITDLDHNGVSEIIFSEKQSLEDHNLVKRSIVQLHDYKRFELYTTSYIEQKKCTLCLIEDIQWGFDDVNSDKIKDLVQDYVLTLQGSEPQLDLFKEVQSIPFENQSFKLPHQKQKLILSAIKTGTNVVEREIRGAAQDFNLSDKDIYCMLDFDEIKTEDTITYNWVHERLGLVSKIKQNIYPALRYRTWLYQDLQNDPRYIGNWIVFITDENKSILASKEFTIHEDVIQLPEDMNSTDHNDSAPILLYDSATALQSEDINTTEQNASSIIDPNNAEESLELKDSDTESFD